MEVTVGLQPGQLVYSRAGRDGGRPFLIVSILDEKYVAIADGDLRRIDRPKKKNIKHLQVTQHIAAEISHKLQRGERVKNRELRAAIAALVGADGAQEPEPVAKARVEQGAD